MERHPAPPPGTSPPVSEPRLLDQVRSAIRRRHYSYRTEQAYIDFEYRQIVVRDGKGGKDRVTMLPAAVVEPLKAHLVRVKALHERDLAAGYGDVELPDALARKYPRAAYDWAWKFVFPAYRYSTCPRTGVIRRHHVFEDVLIRAVKQAAGAA